MHKELLQEMHELMRVRIAKDMQFSIVFVTYK